MSDYDQYDRLCDEDPITLMNRCRAAEEACAAALPHLRTAHKLHVLLCEGLGVENASDGDLIAAGKKLRAVVEARNAGESVHPA